MTELDRLMARLTELYTPHEYFHWMHSPHPQLNGMEPIKALEQGRIGDLHAILDRLDSGAYL